MPEDKARVISARARDRTVKECGGNFDLSTYARILDEEVKKAG